MAKKKSKTRFPVGSHAYRANDDGAVFRLDVVEAPKGFKPMSGIDMHVVDPRNDRVFHVSSVNYGTTAKEAVELAIDRWTKTMKASLQHTLRASQRLDALNERLAKVQAEGDDEGYPPWNE